MSQIKEAKSAALRLYKALQKEKEDRERQQRLNKPYVDALLNKKKEPAIKEGRMKDTSPDSDLPDDEPVTRTLKAGINREKATQKLTGFMDKGKEMQRKRIANSNKAQGVAVKEETVLGEAKQLKNMSDDELKQQHDEVNKKITAKGGVSVGHPLAQKLRTLRGAIAFRKAGVGVKEESELGDLAHAKTLKHRFLVTYSDPKHTMASKRKEKMQKHVLVPSSKDGQSVYQGEASVLVHKHMKRQGYKVHEVEHVGMVEKRVNEEAQQVDELNVMTLSKYAAKARSQSMDKDNPKRYKRGSGAAKAYDKIHRGEYSEETVLEAVTVDKKNYSWGKMVTVHQGKDTSFPLHPEHQAAIKKLRPGMKTTFKDETGRQVHAHREGDQVHLTHHNTGSSTATKATVGYHHFDEGVEINELKTTTLQSYMSKRGNRESRIKTAVDAIHHVMNKKPGKDKHQIHTTGLNRAREKLAKKREQETSMNPQKPRTYPKPATGFRSGAIDDTYGT